MLCDDDNGNVIQLLCHYRESWREPRNMNHLQTSLSFLHIGPLNPGKGPQAGPCERAGGSHNGIRNYPHKQIQYLQGTRLDVFSQRINCFVLSAFTVSPPFPRLHSGNTTRQKLYQSFLSRCYVPLPLMVLIKMWAV